ncbi:MAG: MFS transporter [Betaproteobacteria bacterium]|nr:MFS transporter [Betaproteobacteria bacterium]
MDMNVNDSKKTKRRLAIWTPEDKTFWEQEGRAIANLNLWISIPALFLAFAVWMVWSAVVTKLPAAGFKYSTDELFWLAALPSLTGATLRIPYSFIVSIVGGRRWTAISTLSLLVPVIGIGYAVQHVNTPYWVMVLLAALCGLGGGNFSSSMANISFFFPKARKGSALGLNAGLGNLGVSAVQFMVPLAISMGIFGWLGGDPQTILFHHNEFKQIWLQNAGFIWVLPITLVSTLAMLMMHDISDARASFSEQAVIFKSKHIWFTCWLYLGTFGSFIGFAAGFPLLIKSQFTGIDPLSVAWMGPFLGAISRPIGGWVADKLGGARVTFWNYIVMSLGVIGVLQFLPQNGSAGNLVGFFISFMVLFVTTGFGSGSVFRMIPIIFMEEALSQLHRKGTVVQADALKEGNKQAATALGFAGAMGAYGGFFIPKSYGTSIAMTGSPSAALIGFVVFYLTCIIVTWWFYSRKGAERPC